MKNKKAICMIILTAMILLLFSACVRSDPDKGAAASGTAQAGTDPTDANDANKNGNGQTAVSRTDIGKTDASPTDITQPGADPAETGGTGGSDGKVLELVSKMTLDDKVSQLIIPAIRTRNGKNVTDLSEHPGLISALSKHQYGGVILFAANIESTEQVTGLIYDLQKNNLSNENASLRVPYFLAADQEGGIVTRLNTGTRMTGNMAIGATGENGEANAVLTGLILGEEMKAIGFNVDFAPVVDVNNNSSNPVIGTRSFSDDPEIAAKLGVALSEGLNEAGVIATFKHFPGHGDTSVDSHIGTPSVEKTYEELAANELVPFQAAVDSGAEMIMTAHITFPLVDDEVVFADGVTRGYFPATMSKKIITEILREKMGYDGVIVTDALEMAAIKTAKLVPGAEGSVEYSANVAEKVINAGVDILLLPMDLNGDKAAKFYDEYIDAIAQKVEKGLISEDRINESVGRILKLKEKHGLLDADSVTAETKEEKIVKAKAVVGSEAHHDAELDIARQAVTLVKNDGGALPLSKDASRVLVITRNEEDEKAIEYTIEKLKKSGHISPDAEIGIDHYSYSGFSAARAGTLHYTADMRKAAREADAVIIFSYISGSGALSSMKKNTLMYEAIHAAAEDVHLSGGKLILISTNLPYDSARFTEADAVLLAYMGSGTGIDPTMDSAGGSSRQAYNANVIAAVETVFGANSPVGVLPVNIPVIEEAPDGTLKYGTEILYERGFSVK